MAIYLYCKECRSTSPKQKQKCSRCGKAFPKEGRRYRVSVTVNGKTVTRMSLSLEEAKKTEADIRNDLSARATESKPQTITLDDVWSKYLPWAKENKASWKDDEYNYLKHLKPVFGDKALDEIRPFDIEEFISGMKGSQNSQGREYQPATIKHQIVLLRRLFNVAIKWDMFQKINPVTRVTIPKIDNQITEFMTPEQAERLLEVLETWKCMVSGAFVKFAFYTGLRRGELFKLKWADVDMERGMITLRSPKGGKTITLPVSSAALETLKSLDATSEFVFPGKGGKQMEDFKSPWDRIRKAAGLPDDFRFHGLRHNFASQLVSNGVGLEVVKELMTHKDMITTQRYAHLLPGALKDAAEKSSSILTQGKS